VSGAEAISGGWLLRNAPVGPVLDFISEFQNHPGSMLTDPGPVRRYIEDRRTSELASWDILCAGTLTLRRTIPLASRSTISAAQLEKK
jgi:hypothetical protein